MEQETHSHILLTAFRNTSAELLIKKAQLGKKLLLPNHMVLDSRMLIDAIADEKFDYIISFGQRPNIRNKVHVETAARDGEIQLDTDFDCGRLVKLFRERGIDAKLSHNAGTSFCNRVYWHGLQYISERNLATKMVFIHVPFLKNITDFDEFCSLVLEAIAEVSL